jgi:hypothetical protein
VNDVLARIAGDSWSPQYLSPLRGLKSPRRSYLGARKDSLPLRGHPEQFVQTKKFARRKQEAVVLVDKSSSTRTKP